MHPAENQKQPDACEIAKQLRQPEGNLGMEVAEKMNESNEFLYGFTLSQMKITNHETILEIGFGNGKFFNIITEAAENVKVYGLDFSELMVNEATARNAEAVSTGKLIIKLGRSDELPFSDNLFDTIFCINVVYFWENPSAHLKEIYRVLKPGGKFYTSIRTKQSMLAMPFTQFGFIVYEEAEWIKLLNENTFTNIETVFMHEPEVNANGKKYTLESMCIIAEK